ncbi:MAG: cation:dicarboxylase symporter family transporter, partial [Marinobacter sp.]
MFSALSSVFRPIMRLGLVSQIALGIVAGVLLVIISPEAAQSVALLGQLFVLALKAVAPVLVFVLVAAAIAGHKQGQPTHIRGVLMLYIVGTLVAAMVAVVASFLIPTELTLDLSGVSGNPPSGIAEILTNLL